MYILPIECDSYLSWSQIILDLIKSIKEKMLPFPTLNRYNRTNYEIYFYNINLTVGINIVSFYKFDQT
jgi:hypothetical protein